MLPQAKLQNLVLPAEVQNLVLPQVCRSRCCNRGVGAMGQSRGATAGEPMGVWEAHCHHTEAQGPVGQWGCRGLVLPQRATTGHKPGVQGVGAVTGAGEPGAGGGYKGPMSQHRCAGSQCRHTQGCTRGGGMDQQRPKRLVLPQGCKEPMSQPMLGKLELPQMCNSWLASGGAKATESAEVHLIPSNSNAIFAKPKLVFISAKIMPKSSIYLE